MATMMSLTMMMISPASQNEVQRPSMSSSTAHSGPSQHATRKITELALVMLNQRQHRAR